MTEHNRTEETYDLAAKVIGQLARIFYLGLAGAFGVGCFFAVVNLRLGTLEANTRQIAEELRVIQKRTSVDILPGSQRWLEKHEERIDALEYKLNAEITRHEAEHLPHGKVR